MHLLLKRLKNGDYRTLPHAFWSAEFACNLKEIIKDNRLFSRQWIWRWFCDFSQCVFICVMEELRFATNLEYRVLMVRPCPIGIVRYLYSEFDGLESKFEEGS